MKLSDAILLGSTLLKPKCGVFEMDGDGCALGMANKAVGGDGTSTKLEAAYPWLCETPVRELPCACTGTNLVGAGGGRWCNVEMIKQSVWYTIVHLFNQHVCDGSWTIERLADWVRSVEPAEQPESQQPSAVGATPDSSVGSIALPEDKLEAMVESWRDAESNT